MEEMKTYSVEYKDKGGYTCGEEIEASSEHEAVKIIQMELIKEGGYMTQLRHVTEIEEENNK